MKLPTYAILAAALACGLASAQTTAYTTPVGYVSLGDTTAGQPAIKAQTDVFISIPLDQATEVQGVISLISGSVITIANVTLGDLLTVPHTIKIVSGNGSGIIGLVTASSATTVTVALQPGDSLNDVALGDSIAISKAWTVLGLMGTSMPVNTILYTYPASGAQNFSSVGLYQWDGANWIDQVNTGSPADTDVLYQNETYVVRNPTNTPIPSFVVSGAVSTTNSRVVIETSGAAGSDNAISFAGPVGEQIATSGLAARAQNNDIVYGFDNNAAGMNKSANSVHQFDGTDWIDQVNTGSPDPTFPLGSGVGFVFRRVAASSAAIWTSQPSYVPNIK